MEGVLLFGAFLFGAMLLIMFFGYRSIEQERARSENARTADQLLDQPRFFANLAPNVPPHLLERLGQQLRHEYRNGDGVTNSPTVRNVDSDYNAYVDAVAKELERHIQQESAATTAFVHEPSLERLYESSDSQVAMYLRRQADQDSEVPAEDERAE